MEVKNPTQGTVTVGARSKAKEEQPHYVESLQPPDAHHVAAPLRHHAHDFHGSLRGRGQKSPSPRARVLTLPPCGVRGAQPGGGETCRRPARGQAAWTRVGTAWGRPWRGGSTSSSDVSRLAFLEYLRKSCKGSGQEAVSRVTGTRQLPQDLAQRAPGTGLGASVLFSHFSLPVTQGQGALRWILAAGERSLSQKILVAVSLRDRF